MLTESNDYKTKNIMMTINSKAMHFKKPFPKQSAKPELLMVDAD